MKTCTRIFARMGTILVVSGALGGCVFGTPGSEMERPSHHHGSGSGSGGSGEISGGGGVGGGPSAGAGGGAGDACPMKLAASFRTGPVDMVFLVDNSLGMDDPIRGVEAAINQNLASVIKAAGIDLRVIMVSSYGDADRHAICVPAPLGSSTCNPVPATLTNNPPTFYHYNLAIGTHDSLCKALDSLKGGAPDRNGTAPSGWSQWLRPEARKVLVEVTDDSSDCSTQALATQVVLREDNTGASASQTFDQALTTLLPQQFGKADARNYVFYSLVGLRENTVATQPYLPTDPIVTRQCDTARDPGASYQALSVLTGGLRYPVCDSASYGTAFGAIASSVVSGAKVSCSFAAPVVAPGMRLDLSSAAVDYTPSSGAAKQSFSRVGSAGECKAGAFYVNGNTITLCPDTCTAVQGDHGAQINVTYGCEQAAK